MLQAQLTRPVPPAVHYIWQTPLNSVTVLWKNYRSGASYEKQTPKSEPGASSTAVCLSLVHWSLLTRQREIDRLTLQIYHIPWNTVFDAFFTARAVEHTGINSQRQDPWKQTTRLQQTTRTSLLNYGTQFQGYKFKHTSTGIGQLQKANPRTKQQSTVKLSYQAMLQSAVLLHAKSNIQPDAWLKLGYGLFLFIRGPRHAAAVECTSGCTR